MGRACRLRQALQLRFDRPVEFVDRCLELGQGGAGVQGLLAATGPLQQFASPHHTLGPDHPGRAAVGGLTC